MENIYKMMRNSGVVCLVLGIVIVTVGLSTGILSIVTGARLMKKKSEIIF